MEYVINDLKKTINKRNKHKQRWIGTKEHEDWNTYDMTTNKFRKAISILEKAENKK